METIYINLISIALGLLFGYLIYKSLNSFYKDTINFNVLHTVSFFTFLAVVYFSKSLLYKLTIKYNKEEGINVIYEKLDNSKFFQIIKKHKPDDIQGIKLQIKDSILQSDFQNKNEIFTLLNSLGSKYMSKYMIQTDDQTISNHYRIVNSVILEISEKKPDLAFAILYPAFANLNDIKPDDLDVLNNHPLILSSYENILMNPKPKTNSSSDDAASFQEFYIKHQEKINNYNRVLSNLTHPNYSAMYIEFDKLYFINAHIDFIEYILKLGPKKSGPILRTISKNGN